MKTVATLWQLKFSGYAPVRAVLSLLFVLACASVGLAQDVSVLLLDVRNGHPIQNKNVRIHFHFEGSPYLQTFEASTAANGTAQFHVPSAKASRLSINIDTLYPCFNVFPNDLNEILNKGVVSRCSRPPQGCHCKFTRKVLQVKAAPEQIVVFARPFTLWERFLSHIWE